MIADYMYNTPSLPAGTVCVFILLKAPYASASALNAELLGKSLDQIKALPSVIATDAPIVSRFGFRTARNLTGAYAGVTILPDFDVPKSVSLMVARDGSAKALALAILANSVVTRAVMMSIPTEASATRVAFSVDDAAYVSAVDGPKGVGFMLGKMSKALKDNVLQPIPTVLSKGMSKTLQDVVPRAEPSIMARALSSALRDQPPTPVTTSFAPQMRRTLTDAAPQPV